MPLNNKSQVQIYFNETPLKSIDSIFAGSPKEFLLHLTKLKDEVNLKLTELVDTAKIEQKNNDENKNESGTVDDDEDGNSDDDEDEEGYDNKAKKMRTTEKATDG